MLTIGFKLTLANTLRSIKNNNDKKTTGSRPDGFNVKTRRKTFLPLQIKCLLLTKNHVSAIVLAPHVVWHPYVLHTYPLFCTAAYQPAWTSKHQWLD